MLQLYVWYTLPSSKIVCGNILKDPDTQYQVSLFIQERITLVSETKDSYIVNEKYILAKNGIDNFFKEPDRYKIQMDFIKKFI